ncbi:hypothetical protein A2837_03420 [Candidatus Kaiserbacteria bacterium RIFCSPHIGHO2_01_FULL_46_22]|uniref:ASCH domain-containing protein n=1 Tax=Candidatus Kaiserbacteria bacterium RIFCSPHIGHO2_01_FULL_46_22 TaxID=1798475 RepID=A0A1F6BX48_9BACT|nr:MAG: hypothetical protein A2837_03420 [Candidatus Kaiserbacteria bacterium RIFCSPHIGHO2_01_FULL_46_22]
MKTIKFTPPLVSKVLDGSKTATWRLFDDKDLQIGDSVALVNKDTSETFANAEIINVKEKPLGEIAKKDFDGHETFSSRNEMLATYRSYYGDKVNWNTIVKMIHFKLL